MGERGAKTPPLLEQLSQVRLQDLAVRVSWQHVGAHDDPHRHLECRELFAHERLQLCLGGLCAWLQADHDGLTGKIPDGLLFRVSSIQADETAAYRIQDDFTHEMLKAMSPQARERIIGRPVAVN